MPLGFLGPATRPDSLGRIGHYEVLQVLGRGGFGVVFRAFDDVLHQVVAVKVLAPEVASTSPARKRFLREARSSARVRHENVVQVYEVGEAPLPYLVMEFIPGVTLQQRLDHTRPADVAEAVRVGRQIAGFQSAREVAEVLSDCEAQPREGVKPTGFPRIPRSDPPAAGASGRRKWVAAVAVGRLLAALAAAEFAGLTRRWRGPESTPPVARGPPEGQAAAALDRDRWAAEYVLSVGGVVEVNEQDTGIRLIVDLPREPFRWTGAELENNDRVTDAGLAAFAPCRNLGGVTFGPVVVVTTFAVNPASDARSISNAVSTPELSRHDTLTRDAQTATAAGREGAVQKHRHNNVLTVLANDAAGAGEVATIAGVGATSAGGKVVIGADKKTLVYTPAAGFQGAETFTYAVADGTVSAAPCGSTLGTPPWPGSRGSTRSPTRSPMGTAAPPRPR